MDVFALLSLMFWYSIGVSHFSPLHLTVVQAGKIVMFSGPDEIVGPEGMEKFCEDIGVEPENVSFSVSLLTFAI